MTKNKSWKTTLFGWILAGASFVATTTVVPVPESAKQIASIVAIIGAAGLGKAAKDSNVTGGTIQQ